MPRRREPTISHASSLGYQHWGQTFNLFDLLLFYDKTRANVTWARGRTRGQIPWELLKEKAEIDRVSQVES